MPQSLAPKLRRVKITSSHGITKAFFADTGEEIPHVQRIKFEHHMYGKALARIDQLFIVEEFDIECETPRTESLDEVIAESKAVGMINPVIKDFPEQLL